MAAVTDQTHIHLMEPLNQPDLNTGKPWSEMDDADLRACVADGDTSKAAAMFLCRTAKEVRKRAKELGLTWQARPILRRPRFAKPAEPAGVLHRGRLVPDKVK